MSSSRVTVKYGKKKHKKIEIKATDCFEDIQAIIFSLTQLDPERQKIIVGGKKLENDSDAKALIKNGVLVTVMGSNIKKAESSAADSKIQFVDDMSVAEKQKVLAELPPGLHNLGNTCYLNACLQCIRAVDELKERLKMNAQNDPNGNTMASKLGELMRKLDTNAEAVVPQQFVQYFRATFPRFASRNEQGVWEQQDADEAYTEIMSALRHENGFVMENEKSVINELFEGEFACTVKCTESEQEVPTQSTERFIKLQCFIDINSRHINDGIKKGFTENMEKRSEILDRNAIWVKNKSISKLPKYIPIQLVRFFWKQKTQKNAKILRKIIFPHKLDVYDFCCDDLKKDIEKYRKLQLEKEDKEREKKQSLAADKQEPKPEPQTEEKKMDVDTDSDDSDIKNLCTGYYELCAIVTHKGRSANSGHYIGYSKDSKRNKWLKFDDEDVTEIKSDDVKQLYGGGDHQMAFMCFYRRIENNL